jgi:hypothetical protein
MAANYLVLQDASTQAGHLDIYLPADADPNRRVILALELNPSADADMDYSIMLQHDWLEDADVVPGLGFEANFPGDHERFILRRGHFDGGVARGRWEVFAGSLLSPRHAPFRVPGNGLFHPGTEARTHEGGQYFQRIWFTTSGEGSLQVGDVVLWYKLAE